MEKNLTLFLTKIHDDTVVPKRASEGSSGLDVYAYDFKKIYQHFGSNGEREVHSDVLERCNKEGMIEISYLERVMIGTGLRATIGTLGYDLQVRPRSGLALKQGITVLNTPGTIDVDYRDELCVILINLSRANQVIRLGDRIAQLVIAPVELPLIEVVPDLPPTLEDRGGGFGSSGEK